MLLKRIAILLAAFTCAATLAAPAAPPVSPGEPAVTDMLLTARVPGAAAKSDCSRSILQHGDYLYVSGEPGLQTLHIDPKTGKLTLTDDWTKSSHKMNAAAVLPAEGESPAILYVANWSPGSGLAVFSLKDPAHPKHLKSISTRSHTWTADIHGKLLDVAIDDGTITGINTYDISDPVNPKLLNFLDIGSRLSGNVARLDAKAGRFMYFSHSKWLFTYDAADPAKPKFVRKTQFNGLCGKVAIRDGHLYLLTRKINPAPNTDEGGLHILSLADPGSPKPIAYWSQPEPRDMHIDGTRITIPCSGSGIYSVDVGEVLAAARGETEGSLKIKQLHHFYLAWPNSGKHAGYPVCVTGRSGTKDAKAPAPATIYIGTTDGNNPECRDDPNCPYKGGRVYAVRLPQ